MADHGAALAAALLDTEDAKTTAVRKNCHGHGEYAGSSFIFFGGLCRSLFVNEYGAVGDTGIPAAAVIYKNS